MAKKPKSSPSALKAFVEMVKQALALSEDDPVMQKLRAAKTEGEARKIAESASKTQPRNVSSAVIDRATSERSGGWGSAQAATAARAGPSSAVSTAPIVGGPLQKGAASPLTGTSYTPFTPNTPNTPSSSTPTPNSYIPGGRVHYTTGGGSAEGRASVPQKAYDAYKSAKSSGQPYESGRSYTPFTPNTGMSGSQYAGGGAGRGPYGSFGGSGRSFTDPAYTGYGPTGTPPNQFRATPRTVTSTTVSGTPRVGMSGSSSSAGGGTSRNPVFSPEANIDLGAGGRPVQTTRFGTGVPTASTSRYDPLDSVRTPGQIASQQSRQNYGGYGPTAGSESIRGFFDSIAHVEGTMGKRPDGSPARGYNEVLGYGGYGSPGRPLTEMSLNDVYGFGRSTVGPAYSAAKGTYSTAMGKYQITGKTMMNAAKQMGLDPATTKFTPEIQDRMAAHLALGRVQRGEDLGLEWDGFNHRDGPSQKAKALAALGGDRAKTIAMLTKLAAGLPVDGVANVATANNAGISPNFSQQTVDLQNQLNARGANLTVDGLMGPKTQAAMTKYNIGGRYTPPATAQAVPTTGIMGKIKSGISSVAAAVPGALRQAGGVLNQGAAYVGAGIGGGGGGTRESGGGGGQYGGGYGGGGGYKGGGTYGGSGGSRISEGVGGAYRNR